MLWDSGTRLMRPRTRLRARSWNWPRERGQFHDFGGQDGSDQGAVKDRITGVDAKAHLKDAAAQLYTDDTEGGAPSTRPE